jgi:hypothetical protein
VDALMWFEFLFPAYHADYQPKVIVVGREYNANDIIGKQRHLLNLDGFMESGSKL